MNKFLHRILDPLYRFLSDHMIHFLYNIKTSGLENIPKEGPGVIIANHVSYMDGLILHSVCKRRIKFVIDEYTYQIPFVNHFMAIDGAIPIAANKQSVKNALDLISQALEEGHLVCIFPEGQLTYTGHLSHFKPGIEWIIERDPVPVIPVAIKGMWGSVFSRKYLKAKYRFLPKNFRRKVRVVCGTPVPPEEVKAKQLQRTVLHMKNDIKDYALASA
jgi:1-acyl-sn-glycerol-3-phosphate acyltransferase